MRYFLFQAFYYTHILSVVYLVLFALHAPNCVWWLMVPVAVFIGEKVFREVTKYAGRGKTRILRGKALPSR